MLFGAQQHFCLQVKQKFEAVQMFVGCSLVCSMPGFSPLSRPFLTRRAWCPYLSAFVTHAVFRNPISVVQCFGKKTEFGSCLIYWRLAGQYTVIEVTSNCTNKAILNVGLVWVCHCGCLLNLYLLFKNVKF